MPIRTGKKLTAMQDAFALNFAKTNVQGKSAVDAGYSPRTADSQAHQLLQNAKVLERVEHYRQQIRRAAKLTPEQIIGILEALVTFDIADILDDDGSILPIRDIPKDTRLALGALDMIEFKSDGGAVVSVTKKVRMADRMKAVELLGRHHGLFKDHLILEDGAAMLEAARRGMQRARGEQPVAEA